MGTRYRLLKGLVRYYHQPRNIWDVKRLMWSDDDALSRSVSSDNRFDPTTTTTTDLDPLSSALVDGTSNPAGGKQRIKELSLADKLSLVQAIGAVAAIIVALTIYIWEKPGQQEQLAVLIGLHAMVANIASQVDGVSTELEALQEKIDEANSLLPPLISALEELSEQLEQLNDNFADQISETAREIAIERGTTVANATPAASVAPTTPQQSEISETQTVLPSSGTAVLVPTPTVAPETPVPTVELSATAVPTDVPTPTATVSPAPTSAPTATPTKRTEPTQMPTPTQIPTRTPTPTPTQTPETPVPTEESDVTAMPTDVPTPTATVSPAPTSAPTATATQGAEQTQTLTPTPTQIPETPIPTVEPSATAMPTDVPTPTATSIPTPSPVPTPALPSRCPGFAQAVADASGVDEGEIQNALCAPDGVPAQVGEEDDAYLILDMGNKPIVDRPDAYDFVYFEWPNTNNGRPGIYLDEVVIEIAPDNGNGEPGQFSQVYVWDGGDNFWMEASSLYQEHGILIDVAGSGGGPWRFVRISVPGGEVKGYDDQVQVDSIEVLD